MTRLNLSFKDHIKKYILNNNLFNINHNTRYSLDQILDVIEYILITGSSWRSLNLSIFSLSNIRWQSIYYHFIKFSKAHVFENVYKKLLEKYFKTNKSGKLKFLSIDSSFILNAYASNVGYNGFYKKKKLSKLSLIVDSNGIPISALLARGNKADPSLFDYNMNKLFVNITYHKPNNKHKRYFLADAAYDNYRIKKVINNYNIVPIIWRIRRSKNYQKFNQKQTNIYKRRIIVENCFSWIFKCRRISKRYDKKYHTYLSFLFASFCRLLIRRI